MYVTYNIKYGILQEICGGCVSNKDIRKYHINFWVNSNLSFKNELLQCENKGIRVSEVIEINPPSNRPVNTNPPFNTFSGLCL